MDKEFVIAKMKDGFFLLSGGFAGRTWLSGPEREYIDVPDDVFGELYSGGLIKRVATPGVGSDVQKYELA